MKPCSVTFLRVWLMKRSGFMYNIKSLLTKRRMSREAASGCRSVSAFIKPINNRLNFHIEYSPSRPYFCWLRANLSPPHSSTSNNNFLHLRLFHYAQTTSASLGSKLLTGCNWRRCWSFAPKQKDSTGQQQWPFNNLASLIRFPEIKKASCC